MKEKKLKDGSMNYLDIYTPLSVAKEEVWKRWNDKELRKRVEEFLGGDVPDVFKQNPRAVIGRHVLSPNFELLHFLQLSNLIEMNPLCVEYLRDKFIAKNIDKFYLSKLFFYNGYHGEMNKEELSSWKIMDINRAEGKSLCDLKTVWEENLVDFHHRMLYSLKLNSCIDKIDLSNYLKEKGGVASKYYLYYLALYVCHGVLFENYLVDRKQIDFTKEVVLPSYKKIEEIFGVKPLIVPLVPFEDENDLHWRYYPESVRNSVDYLHNKEDST